VRSTERSGAERAEQSRAPGTGTAMDGSPPTCSCSPPCSAVSDLSSLWAGAHELMIGRAGRPRVRARPVRRRVTTPHPVRTRASCVSVSSISALPFSYWRLNARTLTRSPSSLCRVGAVSSACVRLLADGAPARFCSSPLSGHRATRCPTFMASTAPAVRPAAITTDPRP